VAPAFLIGGTCCRTVVRWLESNYTASVCARFAEDGKPKKVNIDFEPYKPINTSLYLCDNKFHTEALDELLRDDDTFGFIIMDGNGCLFGTLCGSNRTILHKFTVDLPKKHGRGGQSALRFARLRLEKRKNYIRKVAEIAQQLLIDNSTNLPNVVCDFVSTPAVFVCLYSPLFFG